MRAMVLCAGFGTRLRPLTDSCPKPMVPLCGIPLLRYNFALLKTAGVQDLVVNTHHLGPAMEKGAIAEALLMGLNLSVSREERHILGTGGGLKKAAPQLAGGAFFVLNGDMMFDVDLSAALAAHKAFGAIATMVLAPYPPGATYGSVEVDAGDRVRRIAGRGASPAPGEKWTKRHFTGVHILEPEALSRLPEGESDINRTAYVRLIHDGARVLGYLQNGAWADLGAPKSYLKSNLDLLAGRVPMERFKPLVDPWAGAREHLPGIFVHEGAQIDPSARLLAPLLVHTGAKIAHNAQVGPDVVLGRNVRIDTEATVSNAVLWDNTHLSPSERVENAIGAPGVRLEA